MQGKSLAQKNKRGRKAKNAPQRTRRKLPVETEENSAAAQAELEARQAEKDALKQAKLEAKQAKKHAKLEEKQAKKQAKLEKKQAKEEAVLEARQLKAQKKAEQKNADVQSQDQPPVQSEPVRTQRHSAERPGRYGDDEPKPKRKSINTKAVVRYTFIIVLISAVLSIGLLYVLDLTGWRSAAREKVVNYLIAKERDVLNAQLTLEYDAKVDAMVEQRLAQERQALALDQGVVDAKDAELATRQQEMDAQQKQIDLQQSQVDAEYAELEKQKSDFEAAKFEFENKKLEIADLATLNANMEPENAANIIEAMTDTKLIIQIFSSMKKDDAAAILELMDTQKAADIISKMGE